jgi:hypothetical protein
MIYGKGAIIIIYYKKKLSKTLSISGGDEPLLRRENGDIGDPLFAGALSIAGETVAHLWLKIVSNNGCSIGTTELNQSRTIGEGGISVIDDNRMTSLQRLLDELELSASWSPVIGHGVFAHQIVGGGEVSAKERALARALQANQNNQFHAQK